MTDIIQKALNARRESKHIEFKQSFDPASPGEWCELVKDLAALANSGGGIIVFGLDNVGQPSGNSVEAIAGVDPADIANKISRYTGQVDFEFEIRKLEKNGAQLVAFIIPSISVPLVFQKPGTYDIGGGRQKTAFGIGTVYFRHGAKSEPGTSQDLRRVIERQLESFRKSWIKGVRKVVKAPAGTQIVSVSSPGAHAQGSTTPVRVVSDPDAVPVKLTRDSSIASGSFLHEEVSEGIFDEINNVVDANRVLAKGKIKFLLGQPVYYRIYAERQHVRQTNDWISSLLEIGLGRFYAPALFWAVQLPNAEVAKVLSKLFLHSSGRFAYSLMRVGTLLGPKFTDWLLAKWKEQWKGHTQRPDYYYTLKEYCSSKTSDDFRLQAARISAASRLVVSPSQTLKAQDVLSDPELASRALSNLCVKIFEGRTQDRSLARTLDCLAYGEALRSKADAITKQTVRIVGDRLPYSSDEDTEPA